MTIINATNARKKLYQLIEEVRETHEPVYITGKTGNVVMLSDEDYRSILSGNTLPCFCAYYA